MTRPIAVQITNRLQVSGDEENRLTIIRQHVATPAGATSHTQGVRKVRLAFGVVIRRIMMPPQTAMKARSVPTDTNSARISRGNAAASNAAKKPTMIVPRCGVLNLG